MYSGLPLFPCQSAIIFCPSTDLIYMSLVKNFYYLNLSLYLSIYTRLLSPLFLNSFPTQSATIFVPWLTLCMLGLELLFLLLESIRLSVYSRLLLPQILVLHKSIPLSVSHYFFLPSLTRYMLGLELTRIYSSVYLFSSPSSSNPGSS